MAKNLSAIAKGLDTLSEKEARWAGWDPQLEVPVVEMLGYEELGGAARLNRVLVSSTGYMMVSGSTGGGTLTLSDDAADNRVSTFSPDAGLMRVSAVGGSTVSLSADAAGNRVSAVQGDASNLMVSGKSGDAGTFRVSAIGGTAGDNTLVDGSDQSVSARLIQVSASVSSNMNTLLARITSYDAANAHVSSYQGGSWTLSAFINEGTVSARNTDASTFHVSGKSDSAGQLRVSSFSNDATTFNVSAKSDSAALFRVSALGITLATAQTLSATLKEGTAFVGSVSAKSTDAANLNVSAKSDSAALFRVSADLIANTTGALTVFRSISLSASQTVKSTAGALYGYFLANTDTKFNYVKFYNTSGAINVGTDTPVLTIPIPPSAGANVEYPHGIAGFTNGIGVVALSAIADNATTSSPASAVVGNIFYK